MKLVPLVLALCLGVSRASLFDAIGKDLSTVASAATKGLGSLANSVQSAITGSAKDAGTKLETLTKDAEGALGLNSSEADLTAVPNPDDQLKIYQNQLAYEKAQKAQQAIESLLSPTGDLNPAALDSLLSKAQQKYLEKDYRMALSKASVDDIIESLSPIVQLENEINDYKSLEGTSERLVSVVSVNQRIYTRVNGLYNQRTTLKKDLLVLSQNLDHLRRSDFDLAGFYFSGQFSQEITFLGKRPDAETAQLYNIFVAQKDVFVDRLNQMQTVYDQFNRDLADIFANCDDIFSTYLALQKRAQLANTFPEEVDNKLAKLFELRRDFAEQLLIYQASLDNIRRQKELFLSVLEATEEVEEASAQRDEIEAIFKEFDGFRGQLTEAQKAKLQKLKKEAMEDQVKIVELAKQAVRDANDPTLTVKEKEERAEMRQKTMKAILQKSKQRKAEIDEIRQSLKDIQLNGNEPMDRESPEDYFRRREKEDKENELVENLKVKIDKGELTMAEVADPTISDKIAQKEIQEVTAQQSEGQDDTEEPEDEAGQTEGQSLDPISGEPVPDIAPLDGSVEPVRVTSSVFDPTNARKLLASHARLAVGALTALLAFIFS